KDERFCGAMADPPLTLRPFRVTAIGQRGLLATKTFCCRNRPYGRFGQQNVLIAKSHRGGRGSRLAKRSGATGEAGSALTRARLDGGAVFGICVLARARFLSLDNQKPTRHSRYRLVLRGPRSWRFNSP